MIIDIIYKCSTGPNSGHNAGLSDKNELTIADPTGILAKYRITVYSEELCWFCERNIKVVPSTEKLDGTATFTLENS